MRKWLAVYLRWKGLKGILLCLLHLLKHALQPRGRLFVVRDDRGAKAFLRSGTSDLRTFRTVVVQQELLFPTRAHNHIMQRYREILAAGSVPVIADGGANIGLTARHFARQFPEARVIAVEPDEPNCSLAKMNCAMFQNILLVKAALWDCDEPVETIDPHADEWSYQFKSSGNADNGNAVNGHRIDTLLSAISGATLFLLKLDIEGAEARVLRDEGRWWSSTPILLVEPHDYLDGQANCLGGIMAEPAYQRGNAFICGGSILFLPMARAEESRDAVAPP